jgi:hypothetical protein
MPGDAGETDAEAEAKTKEKERDPDAVPREMQNVLTPFARLDDEKPRPLGDRNHAEKDSIFFWMIFTERAQEADEWLRQHGWTRDASAPGAEIDPLDESGEALGNQSSSSRS